MNLGTVRVISIFFIFGAAMFAVGIVVRGYSSEYDQGLSAAVALFIAGFIIPAGVCTYYMAGKHIDDSRKKKISDDKVFTCIYCGDKAKLPICEPCDEKIKKRADLKRIQKSSSNTTIL